MANEQSKIDKLIAAGATPEELARVRAEDESGLGGHLRGEERFVKSILRTPSERGKGNRYASQLTPEEIAARKAHADQLAAVQQRGQDIQRYGEERTFQARMARMKQEAQAEEERKFKAQSEPLKPID